MSWAHCGAISLLGGCPPRHGLIAIGALLVIGSLQGSSRLGGPPPPLSAHFAWWLPSSSWAHCGALLASVGPSSLIMGLLSLRWVPSSSLAHCGALVASVGTPLVVGSLRCYSSFCGCPPRRGLGALLASGGPPRHGLIAGALPIKLTSLRLCGAGGLCPSSLNYCAHAVQGALPIDFI